MSRAPGRGSFSPKTAKAWVTMVGMSSEEAGRLGVIKNVAEAAARLGAVHQLRAGHRAVYSSLLPRRRMLFQQIFSEN